MTFRQIFITFLFSLVALTACAQKMDRAEADYFVLGTLSDYSGRYLDPRLSYMFDNYDGWEDPLVWKINSILRLDYDDPNYQIREEFDSFGLETHIQIMSDSLSKKFNSYYTFKETGSSTSDSDPELNDKAILYGALKPDIFKNNLEKLAFLAGAYVRFGVPNDTAYMINIGNSVSKAKVCYELLKEFNCRPTYEVLKNSIPVMYHVFFHPNRVVKNYFKPYMHLRKKIAHSELLFVKKIIANEEKKKKEDRLKKF